MGHVLGDFLDVGFELVVVGLRLGKGATGSGELLAHDLVEGSAGGDFFAEPFIPEGGGLVGDLIGVVAGGANLEEFGPLHDPDFGELLAFDELVDELGTFVGGRVSEEAGALFAAGEETDEVEVDAADEVLVGGELGGDDTELVKFFVNVIVDVVLRLDTRFLVVGLGGNDDVLAAFGKGVEARHEEGFASLGRNRFSAVRVDFDGAVVGAGEAGKAGDVAIGSIGILGADGELHALAGAFENGLGGFDGDAGGKGDVGGIVFGAVLQPAKHSGVEGVVFLEKFAAGVGNGADGLGEEEGFLGDGEVDTAA